MRLAAITGLGLLALLLALTGCTATIPTDPEGTLDRVRGETIHAGVSPNEPWTDPGGPADPSAPSGIEVDLVEAFAQSIDAEVQWTVGGEQELIGMLERGELEIVVGGLIGTSPWSAKAALTAPYATTRGPQGQRELHVMATPMGENAFLVELERFLLRQEVPA